MRTSPSHSKINTCSSTASSNNQTNKWTGRRRHMLHERWLYDETTVSMEQSPPWKNDSCSACRVPKSSFQSWFRFQVSHPYKTLVKIIVLFFTEETRWQESFHIVLRTGSIEFRFLSLNSYAEIKYITRWPHCTTQYDWLYASNYSV
jgi:hypothetical protein